MFILCRGLGKNQSLLQCLSEGTQTSYNLSLLPVYILINLAISYNKYVGTPDRQLGRLGGRLAPNGADTQGGTVRVSHSAASVSTAGLSCLFAIFYAIFMPFWRE